jgi:hypothetical protein
MRNSLWLMLGLAGCASPAGMQVRGDVAADAETIRIAAVGDGLAMGPWQASGVDRGWSYAYESGFGTLRREDAQRTWAFTLEGGREQRLHVACLTTERGEALDIAGLDASRGHALLSCAVRDEEGRRIGRLALPVDGGEERGFVAVDGLRIAIASAHELVGGSESRDAAGFEFRDDTRALGALQMVNEKILWVPRSVDDESRETIAVAAAALALYDGAGG